MAEPEQNTYEIHITLTGVSKKQAQRIAAQIGWNLVVTEKTVSRISVAHTKDIIP